MAWEVEFTDEFGAWWDGLAEDEQDAIEEDDDRGEGCGVEGELGVGVPNRTIRVCGTGERESMPPTHGSLPRIAKAKKRIRPSRYDRAVWSSMA